MALADSRIEPSDAPRVSLRAEWRFLIILFLGFVLLYGSLSPLYFRPMGYMEEEFIAAKQVLSGIAGAFTRPAPVIDWPRHGALPVFTHLPFVAAGRILFGPSLDWQDKVFALEPVVLSAGLLAILFLWARRLGVSRRFAAIAAIATGFCTIYWPYAYFGMEPAQSLFLLLAGYIAIHHRRTTWPSLVALGIATGMAAAVKSTGVFLIPALMYANWVFFRELDLRDFRRALPKIAAAGVIAGGIILFSAWTRGLFWAPRGGTSPYLELWLVRDPITYLINVVAFLTSPNKGLFVFVPLALFAVAQLPRLIRDRSDLAVFASLITMAVAFGYTLFLVWSDETFGPRYFHCAIAPLVLCIVEAYQHREKRALKHPGLLACAVLGFAIALLGALFGYGQMQTTATQTGQATLENFQGNTVWNHVRFNARLLRAWIDPEDVVWTPKRTWIGQPPAWALSPASVNLTRIRDVNQRRAAVPQAWLITTWGEDHGRLLRVICMLSFFAGLALLIVVLRDSHRVHPEAEGTEAP